MSYTNITKPTQGDTTRKAFADAVIDNDAFFYSRLSVLSGLGISNGGFDLDSDSDGIPDEWDRTLYTGGSFEITGVGESDTENRHGTKAVKFTSPGGSGNGGGYLQTADFMEVTPARLFAVSWQSKSTVATIRNKVIVRWYDDAETFISADEIFSSVDNPTDWQLHYGYAYPPATARFAKIRIVGAEDSTTVAGSAYFDDFQLGKPNFTRELVFDTAGTITFEFPNGVNFVHVECLGAGASGGGEGNSATGPGGGGGAGGYCAGMVKLTDETTYAIVVGAGGAAVQAGVSGTDGGNSSFGSELTANGGTGGAPGTGGGAGAGGAGGSATGGGIQVTGDDGEDGVTGGKAGDGSANSFVGGLKAPGLSGGGGGGQNDAVTPGSGGSGAKGSAAVFSGAGYDGKVIVRW